MTKKFEQLSSASGFMKHNGGLLFRTISEDRYEFKTIVTENRVRVFYFSGISFKI